MRVQVTAVIILLFICQFSILFLMSSSSSVHLLYYRNVRHKAWMLKETTATSDGSSAVNLTFADGKRH
ncbi:hypothetical protein L596_020776 [Steinernema carpocapsae]|uniref:Uncharacterized protein n=1 Tax=Steinernema carpocapsae TaxID=34508 RepID=A0A4U5MUJ3_STECR|nr:hypothetical protein L596_020776 [Steinernema carpocapsae]